MIGRQGGKSGLYNAFTLTGTGCGGKTWPFESPLPDAIAKMARKTANDDFNINNQGLRYMKWLII